MPSPRKVIVLKSRAQLDALASPVRLEILEQFKDRPPRSIADLARDLDRPANALTYHVGVLVKAGILVDAGTRGTAGRAEALYLPAGREIALGIDPRSAIAVGAASRSAGTILRLAEREVRRALSAGALRGEGRPPRPAIRRIRAYLTDRDATLLARRLDALQSWLADCAKKKEGCGHAVTIVVVPVAEPSRRHR